MMADRSRAERLERVRGQRKRVWVLATAGALVFVAASAGGIVWFARSQADPTHAPSLAATTEAAGTTLSSVATTASVPIEVPVLTGMPIADAELLTQAAGLTVVRVPTPAGESAEGIVLSQDPPAGTRISSSTPIRLVYADTAAAAAAAATMTNASAPGTGYVVCIDPGHQGSANSGQEPVGPGAGETKAKVTGGATGVVSGTPEHELALALSLKVKERLERYGVVVVMTRTTSAVDISNAQRAAVANQSGADLFLRIHADSNTNADVRGISTLYPSGNEWVAPIEVESLSAAELLQKEMLVSTGAPNRGLMKRADLAGFNYAAVPSVLVECGFLSNPADDRQLNDAAYQDDLADGIARGVLKYLGVTER
jgi:N-acetylmuramoyl-L-alanine amidase